MDSNQSQIKQSANRIRENAKCWSLEGDAEFLRLMSNISNNLIARGNKTTLDMHKMALQLSTTSVGLNNVTNKLLALQNSQFIENRVREEDDCLSDTSDGKTEVDASPKELPLSQYVHEAFQSGVKMMDKFYDRVTYNFDDSDDETGGGCQKSVLYLPKNVYKNRSLPFIIGSKEWQENRHIGITNVEDAPKDGDGDDLQGSAQSFSLSDTSNRSVASDSTDNESHFEDEDQLFDEKESSSDPSGVAVFKPPPVNVFPETGSSKHIDEKPLVNPVAASMFRPENFPSQYVSSNLFDDEPPEISVAATVKSKEYKPANLFADDSDEDFEQDQIASPDRQENQKPEISASAIQPTPLERKPANLFADNSSDDGDHRPADKKLPGDRRSKESEPKATNLFAGNSSDDDQLFSTKSKANIPSEKANKKSEEVSYNIKNKKSTNLFAGNSSDDDDDQLFASKFRAGAGPDKKSMSKLVDEIKSAVGSGNKITLNKPVASKANVQSPISDIKSKTVMPKSTNLFAGDSTDEDDPLFSSKVVNVKNAVQCDKTKSAVPKPISRLFADSDTDEENKLFSAQKAETQAIVPIIKPNIPKSSNLFDENSPPKKADQNESGAAKHNESNNIIPKAKLFENVNTEDKTLSSQRIVKGLVDGEDPHDDNPQFGDKIKEENNKKVAPVTEVNIFKSTILFGDDIDDDYDDLFAPKSKTSAKTTLSAKDSVREDVESSENIMKPVPPSKIIPKADLFKSSNIFGDDSDSDDGLFAPKISLMKESTGKQTPTEIPMPNPTTIDNTNIETESDRISPVVTTEGELLPEDNSVVDYKSEIENTPVENSKNTVQSAVNIPNISPVIGEKYDFLNSLLGEGPPDESFDIFKASKSKVTGRPTIASDSFDDEKNSLFSDDDFLEPQTSNSSEKSENNPQTIDTPGTDEKKTYGNYSSLHLFSDEPPDDDDNSMFSSGSMKHPKRKLIGVFDDTSNVIGKDAAGSESISNEGYSYMLFANEPPPFDSNEKAPEQQKSLSIQPDIEKRQNQRLAPENIERSKMPKEPENEPLIANRIYNPTAPSSSLKTSDIPKEKEISTPALSNLEVASTLDSSLTKSRAKFSKPRRRSTRYGRKQQYEKYLASPEEEQITVTKDSASNEKNVQDVQEGPKDLLPSVSPKVVKPRMYNLSGSQKELQSNIVSELKKRTSKLFQDSNEDDASGTNEEGLVDKTVSVVSSKTHDDDKLFKEDSQEKIDRNDSATLGNTAKTSQETDNNPKETRKNVTTPLLSSKIEKKKSLSLFGDDSSDEDFFDSIKKSSLSTKKGSSSSTVAPALSKSESISVKKDTPTRAKPAKLFTSSEDDDDALFSTKSKDKLEPKKAVVANAESRKVVPVAKKVVKTASLSTAVENPLADLFD